MEKETIKMIKRAFSQNSIGNVKQVFGQIWGLRLQEYYYAKAIRELHAVLDFLLHISTILLNNLGWVALSNMLICLQKMRLAPQQQPQRSRNGALRFYLLQRLLSDVT